MAILHRLDLQAEISERIAKGHYFCEEDPCKCRQQVLDELKYAIFSHRWDSDELVFDHFMMLEGPPPSKNKISVAKKKSITWAIETLMASETPPTGTLLDKLSTIKGETSSGSIGKLLHFRSKSMDKDCKYGWADTVCINKTSSAELDESLRSMYAWYRDSHVCIVWLSETDHVSQMERDPWFTRGWTLQELLAPKRVAFYARFWAQITKSDSDKLEDKKKLEAEEADEETENTEAALWPTISEITGIPLEDLLDFKPGPFDIGKRLSWASKRRTTRVEDQAYCLIGIFNVVLPIAYGEHDRAFYRLQAELVQSCNDKSIFGWKEKASQYNSMLAAAPPNFSEVTPPVEDVQDSDPILSMTNIGLRMPVLLLKIKEPGVPEAWKLPGAESVAIIGKLKGTGKHLVVVLAREEVDRQYRRLDMLKVKITGVTVPKKPEVIYIK
ncbi:1559_t:CDS:1 [Acaulospora colombiana]|uniref:1559_t:CDS:1 n=1 Tax=Acaulospora colombiana TaxID=27376 RepID=A0ACA9NET5_9GLOM|nr:1559_t:CDS:1 [Acaulospora colombiana]